MLKVAPFEIISVVNGTIRLDGGAMFGVVPKVLWAEAIDADDQNRVLLATRTLIAVDRTAGRVILVDTGCGIKWTPSQAARYAIATDAGAIPGALANLGLAEEDVTDVVITHLHFDHNGGLTDWQGEPGGETTLKYPRARHWVHRRHWEHAQAPSVKDRASFLPQDFEALAGAGVLHFVESEGSGWVDGPHDGLGWFVSNGHTPFQLHPVFGSGEQKLLFAGDIMPTSLHLRLAWVMAYDIQPLATIEEKKTIFERCLSDGLYLAFSHDPWSGGAEVGNTVERIEVRRTLPLDP